MLRELLRATVLSCSLLSLADYAAAQSSVRYDIDQKSSLAWWQIDPNYGHLWASTCPDDPNWQAGEGRSPGARVDFKNRKKHVASASKSRERMVPMYPRLDVYEVCRPAVRGGVLAPDTVRWTGLRGEVVVLPDSLDTGLEMRSLYARKAIFETHKHRQIRFVLDSLSTVQPGDTIRGFVHGTLELHGVHKRIKSPIKVWRVPQGLRVQTIYDFPAEELTDIYKMSKMALEMGTSLGRWNTVYFGVDMILRRAEPE
ncbi:MAG TPA: YceI family protein [Longimicrobiales bacterium]